MGGCQGSCISKTKHSSVKLANTQQEERGPALGWSEQCNCTRWQMGAWVWWQRWLPTSPTPFLGCCCHLIACHGGKNPPSSPSPAFPCHCRPPQEPAILPRFDSRCPAGPPRHRAGWVGRAASSWPHPTPCNMDAWDSLPARHLEKEQMG